MNNSIVVYRSQYERDWDQLLYQNPDIILWFAGGLLTLFLGLVVTLYWRRRR